MVDRKKTRGMSYAHTYVHTLPSPKPNLVAAMNNPPIKWPEHV